MIDTTLDTLTLMRGMSVQHYRFTVRPLEAIVLEDRQLSVPLLGMSFLNRVNMNRDGDMLTLSQRY